MLKLSKKGFSLIEGVICMLMFTIMIFASLNIYGISLKIKAYNNKYNEYIYCLNILKLKFQNELDFDDIISLGELNNPIYINNVNVESIKNNNIEDIISTNKTSNDYIEIEFKNDNIMTINLLLNFKYLESTKEIQTKVFRGRY